MIPGVETAIGGFFRHRVAGPEDFANARLQRNVVVARLIPELDLVLNGFDRPAQEGALDVVVDSELHNWHVSRLALAHEGYSKIVEIGVSRWQDSSP